MSDDHGAGRRPVGWRAILGDVHFWIPVAVLLAGLLVLYWIE